MPDVCFKLQRNPFRGNFKIKKGSKVNVSKACKKVWVKSVRK